jgi:hypothetical protein
MALFVYFILPYHSQQREKEMKKLLSIFIALGLVLFSSYGFADESKGKDYFQEHLYEVFYNSENTWHNARDNCESLGGHLATISTKEEDDFLTDLLLGIIPETSFGAFIGLSDEADEGVWEWVTGEPLNYTNWDIQEPYGNGDYVHKWMYLGPVDIQGAWNDVPADYVDYYICECADDDGDGVCNNNDDCPETPEFAIDDGVVGDDGCVSCELLDEYVDEQVPPDGEYRNHGDYVSQVAHIVDQYIEAELITEECARSIVSFRARSDVGKPAKAVGKKK